MKRVARVITVFVISISVIVCNSFSVFAYNPVIYIPSAAWDVAADGTYKAVYPDAAPPVSGFIDDVFKHSEYDGKTYFTSDYWDDNYEYLSESTITFPEFVSYFSHNFFVVRSGDTFFLFCLGYSLRPQVSEWDITVDLKNSVVSLHQNISEIADGGEIYSLSYPYTTWEHYDYIGDTLEEPLYYDNFPSEIIGVIWSDLDIKYTNYSGTYTYKADDVELHNKEYTITYEKPLSVLTGTMSYALTGDVLKRLVKGDYVIRWSDLGFIIGTATNYIYYNFSLSLYYNGSFSSYPVFDNVVFDGATDADISLLESGYAYPPETSMSIFSIYDDVPFEDVILVFNFVFVSTGYNLFFPGDIEFIKFDDFEEDSQHNEITGTLNTISGTLTDLNNNMPSAIRKELEPIYADIKQDLSYIINGDTGVPDVNFNTSDLDDIVEEQDEIMLSVYSDIDNLTNDMLERFGYSSMDEFFQDNMNDLNDTNMLASFDFVKMLFEKVLSATGISVLMLFSLTFAFAMYILGRRLS